MILRLVELGLEGSPADNMNRFSRAAVIRPVPDAAVLPELFTTGYVLDTIPSLALSEGDLKHLPLSKAAKDNGIWIIGGTLPVKTKAGVVNRMVVYSSEGSLVYQTEKVHLFRQMGEEKAFVPGGCGGIFPFMETTAAGIVCYDLRFPELSKRLSLEGAEILFVPAQWPKARLELFRSLLRARAAEAQIFTAGCNIGGEHLGVLFEGGGGVVHPGGKMIRARSVAEGVSDFEIDLSDVKEMRKHINCLEDRRPEEYGILNGQGGYL
jgi:predicted amidohydrolase